MMRNVGDFSKSNCCGCTACENVCPVAAIKMEPDELGFKFPQVDQDACNTCGLCLKVCQFHSGYKRYDDSYECRVYGMRRRDGSELGKSQSGGVAAVIAEKSVDVGSIVYGVGFTEHFGVRHKRATTRCEIEEFRGSKYIQSELDGVFNSIRSDLRDNQKVVFFGTSCQVAGLKSFLPKSLHSNLICIDLVCHGVSSPQLWTDHLDSIKNKYRKVISKVNFRDKQFGWHSRKETITFNDGTTISPITFKMLNDWAIRESCSKCPFTNTQRVGDLSIGDFWGWEKYYPFWNDNKGVSLVLINTKNGGVLFDTIKDEFDCQKSEMSSIAQPQLQHPLVLNESYYQFLRDYSNRGYKYVSRKYADQGLKFMLLGIYTKLGIYKLKSFFGRRK